MSTVARLEPHSMESPFTVQAAEITESWILIRGRTGHRQPRSVRPSGPGPYRLTDATGRVVQMEQSGSYEDGPFEGIFDVAFSVSAGLDLEGPLTLSNDSGSQTFTLPDYSLQ